MINVYKCMCLSIASVFTAFIKDFFDFLTFKTLRNNKKLKGVLRPLIKKCWFVVPLNIFSITKTSQCNFKRLVHRNRI